MAGPILKVHSVAEAEMADARDWYAAKSVDTAAALLTELDRALKHIVEEPLLAPKYLHGTRAYLLRGFPYMLVYDTHQSAIRVIALAHTGRRPGYWKDRLRTIDEP